MARVSTDFSNERNSLAGGSGPAKDRICARIIDYGILGLIIFSPLPAASVNQWSVLVIELSVLVMLTAYVLMTARPQNNEFLLAAVRWPRRLFVGLFLFVLIQTIPLPKFVIKAFSPGAYNYQELYAVNFSQVKFLSFSLIPSVTLQKGLEFLAYFLLGFLVLKTITRRRHINRIVIVLVAAGVFEALYGMFELYNKYPRILFYKKIHNLDSVTGTFVNRNHFSGFLEMIIPLAIGLLVARINLFSMRDLTWREKILRLQEKGLAANLFILFAIVLMSLAIVFSKSRSGIFILVFTFILFSGLIGFFSGISQMPQKRVRTILRVVFLLIVMIAFYRGFDATLQRFSFDNLLREGRPTYWANTLQIFSDYPLFGTGFGTFGALYPPMEIDTGPVFLVHAHNDYLEYLTELGIVGFGLLLAGILWIAVVAFLVWRMRKHPEISGLALGGIVSLICISIHSLTDFNLHIPANLVLFSIVLPLTLVAAFYQWKPAPPKDKR
jgi:O-antigen ligase